MSNEFVEPEDRRMGLSNTTEKWGAVAQLFHWLIALLVLAMIGLGLSATNWPLTPLKFELFIVHKSIGVCVFVLMVLRLLWRIASPVPILPPSLVGWERAAAKAVHWLLYGVVLLMPISGYVTTSAADFPLSMFGLFDVPLLVAKSKPMEHAAQTVHVYGFYVLAALIVLHTAAALRHHYILKDDILKRMLPGPPMKKAM
jgi:cytochrome b561